MHILLLHQYFLPDQAPGSIRWNELVRYWANAGHRITVLAGTIDYTTGKPYTDTTESAFPANVRIVRVRVPGCYQSGVTGRLWAYFRFMMNSLQSGRALADASVDVIIASSPPLTIGLTGWLLALRSGAPLVLELRDLWPDAPLQLGFLPGPLLRRAAYWLEGFLYRKAAHLVVLTEAFKTVLINRKKIETDRISVIPNGADLLLTEAQKKTFKREAFREEHDMANGFQIIYAGAHGLANGLDMLPEAADRLRHTPVRFLLIGDGPVKKSLQEEAFHRKLTNMRFIGAMPKKQVLAFMLAADAGMVSMRSKPVFRTMLSAKLFDYLACGLPVLTTIDGLTRQLLTDAGAGIFLNPHQPDTWEQVLAPLITDPTLRRQYGQQAYQLAVNRFDREVLAGQYLDLLKTITHHG